MRLKLKLIAILILILPGLAFAGPSLFGSRSTNYRVDVTLLDDIAIKFGTDSDIHAEFDSGNSYFELGDGTNPFITVSDQGTDAFIRLYDHVGIGSAASTSYSLKLGGNSQIIDGVGWIFGTNADWRVLYDEATDDALEWSDGTNTFMRWTDNGTDMTFRLFGDLQISDDEWISTPTSNLFKYNSTTGNIETGASLEVGPFMFAEDTGVSWLADMPVSASSADGTEMSYGMRIDGNNVVKIIGKADGVGGADTFQFIVDPDGNFGAAANPSLAFGDGDTGIYESLDDTLNVTLGGTNRFSFAANMFTANTSTGGAIANEGVSSTNPTLLPSYNDSNTGVGRVEADTPAIIGGGVSSQVWNKTVTLSTAQVNALRASPITLVAAQGSNTIIEFLSAVITYDYASAAFTVAGDEDLVIEYADGTDITASIETTGFLDQADDEIRFVPSALAVNADLEASINQAVRIFNTGAGETADGGGEVDIRFSYRVYPTGF